MDTETAAGLVVDLVSNRSGRPLLMAIDGASAAGTTTLATAVGRRLGASVVAGDDFYRDMPEQRRRDLTPAEGVEQFFDCSGYAARPCSRCAPAAPPGTGRTTGEPAPASRSS